MNQLLAEGRLCTCGAALDWLSSLDERRDRSCNRVHWYFITFMLSMILLLSYNDAFLACFCISQRPPALAAAQQQTCHACKAGELDAHPKCECAMLTA